MSLEQVIGYLARKNYAVQILLDESEEYYEIEVSKRDYEGEKFRMSVFLEDLQENKTLAHACLDAVIKAESAGYFDKED